MKRNYDTNLLWGKGFTYKNILNSYNKIDRDDVKQKIQNNYFNLIVYGSIRRSDLFLEEAIQSKSKIMEQLQGCKEVSIDKLRNGTHYKYITWDYKTKKKAETSGALRKSEASS